MNYNIYISFSWARSGWGFTSHGSRMILRSGRYSGSHIPISTLRGKFKEVRSPARLPLEQSTPSTRLHPRLVPTVLVIKALTRKVLVISTTLIMKRKRSCKGPSAAGAKLMRLSPLRPRECPSILLLVRLP
ncbi:hypothetical protein Agabi119p4_6119 [Agaricus bisporus var. burnettii]|uniref:Uncharacterized protein n=1 Tax=Agaricus bisporus var. burnettii TaxID=192524 RepID=A0A8H7KFN6_AGABI|nr:hypothetical protein Agabi119p4_6119 [Agaricus bisporus var. burnettii]